MIKGVFFDFYGTIYFLGNMESELEEWITQLHSCLGKCGISVTREKVWNYFHERMILENPPKPDNGMTIFEKRIEIAGLDLGGTMSRTEIEQTVEALLAIWDKYTHLDPECIPLLSSLKKLNKTMGLISNYDHPHHVHELVRINGMLDYFSRVIVSGDYGIKKPDPLIFHLALEKTKIDPKEIIYVGDSEEDVIGANNANLISVLIDRNGRGKDYGQRFTVTSLFELLRFTSIR